MHLVVSGNVLSKTDKLTHCPTACTINQEAKSGYTEYLIYLWLILMGLCDLRMEWWRRGSKSDWLYSCRLQLYCQKLRCVSSEHLSLLAYTGYSGVWAY